MAQIPSSPGTRPQLDTPSIRPRPAVWRRTVRAVALLALLALTAPAQVQNGAAGSLVFGGDTSGANVFGAVPGESFTLDVSGNPNRPFVLLFAPSLSIGEQVFAPGVVLDIGPAGQAAVLMNGLAPPSGGFLNAFANTGTSGLASFSLPLPGLAPLGPIGGLQAFVIDFTVPGFVKATQAWLLTVRGPVPDLAWSHEPATGGADRVSTLVPGAPPVTHPTLTAFEYERIALQRFGELFANEDPSLTSGLATDSPGSFFRRVPPTPSEPRFFGGRPQTNGPFSLGSAPFIRTVHGDVHLVRNVVTGRSGFTCTRDTDVTVIGASFLPPASPGSPTWQRHVDLADGVMAAVAEGAGLAPETIHLVRIDGGIFASSGTAIADVTPTFDVPLTIESTSLTVAGGALWFVGATASTSNRLYRAPLDGSGAAQLVSLPPISTSPLVFVDQVSPEIRVTPDAARFFIRVKNGARSAIMRVEDISPAEEFVSVVVAFSSSLDTVKEFGRHDGGVFGTFALSPSQNRIAFITGIGFIAAVRVCNLDGTGLQTVTTPARFDAAFNQFIDPHLSDDDHLLFWAGTTMTAMDLYAFHIPTGVLSNVTLTNEQSGSSLPINTSPPLSVINPDGQVRVGDRLVIRRTGPSNSPTIPGLSAGNFFGVPFATLVPYNITGDEFPGPGTVNVQGSDVTISLGLAATGNVAWLAPVDAQSIISGLLMSFDVTATAPATVHVTHPSGPAGLGRIFSVEPSVDGTSCLAIQDDLPTATTRIVEAQLGAPFTVVVPPATSVRHQELLRFAAGAAHAGLFAFRDVGGQRELIAIDRTAASTSVLAVFPPLSGVNFLGQALP